GRGRRHLLLASRISSGPAGRTDGDAGVRVRVWVALGVSLAILALLPFVLPNYRVAFLQATFMNVALASSWNIIAGYTGYVSFGHAAFFGVGAYTASLLILRLGAHWLLAALVGGLLAAIIALPLGFILLRLRGPYFASAMLCVPASLGGIAL